MTSTYATDDIRALAMAAWRARGGSEAMGRSLVVASLAANGSGRAAVGLAHFVDYLDALIGGRIDGQAEPAIEQPLPAAIRCDARHGIAQYGFDLALDRLVAAAHGCGIAVFTLRNSYTAGEIAYFVRSLATHGLIGFACANSHAMMAAAPGGAPVYGTNPLAFAVPRPTPRPPLVFDQATSATAFLNIARAVQRDEAIPAGWAAGPDGAITTDPAQAVLGALLPFGGTKGANIALMVELLGAGLSGGQWSLDAGHFREGKAPPDIGLTVIALSPALAPAIADADMLARVDAQLDRLAAGGVHIPGAGAAQALPAMIAVDDAVLAAIRAHAQGPD
ncbi:Ldh family oxidoreductase [Novosphingobium sp. CCH12-A3]|uniref:Ldh family oxidoreductase n=1 Tax=Novosphingobium sp. CCH12-A3 TaxID=1768752 RepID=UPI000785A1C4|nr:Ldh family oxidoreductase [Novosphingobium sp. CCH12-A3]